MTVAELRDLLEQLPYDWEVEVLGDEFQPPVLEVLMPPSPGGVLDGTRIRLMDSALGHVDHLDGRIVW